MVNTSRWRRVMDSLQWEPWQGRLSWLSQRPLAISRPDALRCALTTRAFDKLTDNAASSYQCHLTLRTTAPIIPLWLSLLSSFLLNPPPQPTHLPIILDDSHFITSTTSFDFFYNSHCMRQRKKKINKINKQINPPTNKETKKRKNKMKGVRKKF